MMLSICNKVIKKNKKRLIFSIDAKVAITLCFAASLVDSDLYTICTAPYSLLIAPYSLLTVGNNHFFKVVKLACAATVGALPVCIAHAVVIGH